MYEFHSHHTEDGKFEIIRRNIATGDWEKIDECASADCANAQIKKFYAQEADFLVWRSRNFQ